MIYDMIYSSLGLTAPITCIREIPSSNLLDFISVLVLNVNVNFSLHFFTHSNVCGSGTFTFYLCGFARPSPTNTCLKLTPISLWNVSSQWNLTLWLSNASSYRVFTIGNSLDSKWEFQVLTRQPELCCSIYSHWRSLEPEETKNTS